MTLWETVILGVATGAGSTYVAVKLLMFRVKNLESGFKRLTESVEGPEGLNVRVAVLERGGHV